MPHFDPHTSFCNFECTICGEVCPTGAILPLTVEDKMQTSIGKAHFEKLNCVVFVNGENCGACAEHCPVKAVRMVDYGSDGLRIPEVNQALCIGCGACEYICPSRPNRAIFVEALQVHELADKPIKVENTFEIEEEFPF